MTSPKPTELLVACLCADWCGACREYKPLFDSLAIKFPNVRFLWVDVEDEADLIDPIEVEDFPTILIKIRSFSARFCRILRPWSV